MRAWARKIFFGSPPLATLCPRLKTAYLKKYWYLFLIPFNFVFSRGDGPRLELSRGQEDYYLPPRYATVSGLKKGNASRCNIKIASPMGAPLSLSGGHAYIYIYICSTKISILFILNNFKNTLSNFHLEIKYMQKSNKNAKKDHVKTIFFVIVFLFFF